MKKVSSDLIKTLTHAMEKISQTNSDAKIFAITHQLLCDFSNSSTSTLFIYKQESKKLYTIKDDNEISLSIWEEQSLLGNAFLLKKSNCYNYVTSEKYYLQPIDNPQNFKLKAQIIIPIIEDEEVIGMMRTMRILPDNRPYSKFELDVLDALESFLIKIIKILQKERDTIEVDTENIDRQITQAKAIQESPQDENQEILSMANTVHDIRTPANALHGFLELIEAHTKDKRIREFITHAKESASFINTLTDSILAKSKQLHQHQNHAERESFTPFNTIKFFASIANLFSANMYDKKINYIIFLDPSLPKEIKTDAIKLKRVLLNLIGNAYKFTPIHKTIYFKVSYNDSSKSLSIFVIDEGIGISKEKQEEIFQPYRQEEEDTHVEYGGTGLGLTISAQYVKDLGGELQLHSDVGKGSQFSFTIPIEVTNSEVCFEKYHNLSNRILILDNGTHTKDIENISDYLVALEIDKEQISISKEMTTERPTHLICFQNQLTYERYSELKKENIQFLIVEDEMFSLSENELYCKGSILSLNTYYGDLLHQVTYRKKPTKILIADDNKINLMLLTSILEFEYVTITTAQDGTTALEKLYHASQEGDPFDILMIDQHMPNLLGTEVIEHYKKYEKKHRLSPIYVISITGDPHLSKKEEALFDLDLKKPFNRKRVQEAILNYQN
jgi:signal transduction histidine kinase